jgi:Tol biopolymer transport system component
VANSNRLSVWWILAGVVAVLACAIELGLWLRQPHAPPSIISTRRITNDAFPKGHLVLSNDGTEIYFDELSSDRSVLARVSTAGGAVTLINTEVSDPRLLDVSGQSELLISSGAAETDDVSFWLSPASSGPARQLGELLGHDPAWEPDGRLVFAKGNDLYVAEHDGTNPRKLFTAPGPPFAMRFSPDGSRMRFTIGNPQSRSTMWEARVDGSGMRPVLPLPGWKAPPAPCCGRWTPNGKYFVFVNAGHIWAVADLPGKASQPVELTSGQLGFHDLVPGRDGKKLFAIGTQPRAELVSYDASSRQFVPFLGGISAGDVDFSHDGQWIVYLSYPDGSLWRSKEDGSERLRLASTPMQVASPRWSPDGKWIAFSGERVGEPWKVWLISKDGGGLQSQSPDNVPETDPTWSADGNTLAFVTFKQPSQITLLDLDTHARSELPDSAGLWHPRWSPDGRSIAALSANSQALMIYDRPARKWKQLAGGLGTMGIPAWSHDGAYVYFDVTTPHDSAYVRLRASDGKTERLASLKNVRRYLGIWGFWSGLAPGDIPLLARDTGEQEIYALDWRVPQKR